MAVSLRDRRPPPKADTIETRARYAWHDIEGDWRVASPRPAGSPPVLRNGVRSQLRKGRALLLHWRRGACRRRHRDRRRLRVLGRASAEWRSRRFDDASKNSASRAARRARARRIRGRRPPICDRMNSRPRSSPDRWSRQPTPERAAPAQDGAESAPGAQASNPLASSIANLELEPEFLSDGIAGKRRSARRGAEDEASATANVAAEQEPPASEARTGKCYVRISGRVLNSGVCQISRKGGAVIFQYSGQTLTLSPARGKSWSAALGGKNLGNVYKSGSCWGSKSTYICDRG